MRNVDKWPTFAQIIRLPANVQGALSTPYLLTAVLNRTQYDQLSTDIPLTGKIETADDRIVVTTLLSADELTRLHAQYGPRAASWRGQYQALAVAVAEACKDVGVLHTVISA